MFEDYAIAIGNMSRKIEELEKRLSVAESHIKILEIDHQIDVINPSWLDEDEADEEWYDWRDEQEYEDRWERRADD